MYNFVVLDEDCDDRIGSEITQETMEKIKMIREKVKQAQDHQKSYANNCRRPLVFDGSDHMFLKVTPSLRLKGSFESRILSPRLWDRIRFWKGWVW